MDLTFYLFSVFKNRKPFSNLSTKQALRCLLFLSHATGPPCVISGPHLHCPFVWHASCYIVHNFPYIAFTLSEMISLIWKKHHFHPPPLQNTENEGVISASGSCFRFTKEQRFVSFWNYFMGLLFLFLLLFFANRPVSYFHFFWDF